MIQSRVHDDFRATMRCDVHAQLQVEHRDGLRQMLAAISALKEDKPAQLQVEAEKADETE